MPQPPTEFTTESVTALLLEDHRNMKALLEAFTTHLKEICTRQSAEAEGKVKDILKRLIHLMNIHADCEEQALFPALGAYHPLPVLEIEHDEIMLARASLVLKTFHYSFPEDCNDKLYRQGFSLMERLLGHWHKEEQLIFPLAEQALSPEEKYRVISEMRRIRNERDRDVQGKAAATELSYAQQRFYPFRFPLGPTVLAKIRSQSSGREGRLQFRTVDLQAGETMGTHWASVQVVLLLCSGQALWRSRETSLLLNAGDGILMDPKLPHSITAQENTSFLLLLYHDRTADSATFSKEPLQPA